MGMKLHSFPNGETEGQGEIIEGESQVQFTMRQKANSVRLECYQNGNSAFELQPMTRDGVPDGFVMMCPSFPSMKVIFKFTPKGRPMERLGNFIEQLDLESISSCLSEDLMDVPTSPSGNKIKAAKGRKVKNALKKKGKKRRKKIQKLFISKTLQTLVEL